MGVRAVRAALKTALTPLGMNGYDVFPSAPELPAYAIGWPDVIDIGVGTLGGGDGITLPITVAYPTADLDDAQRKLDDLIDQLPALVHDHETAAWRYAQVVTVSNIDIDKAGEAQALVAEFTTRIIS